MVTEIFHTQLLRCGIPRQSVYAHVVSWALSNQKFLSVLFSCNFSLFFIICYLFIHYYLNLCLYFYFLFLTNKSL